MTALYIFFRSLCKWEKCLIELNFRWKGSHNSMLNAQIFNFNRSKLKSGHKYRTQHFDYKNMLVFLLLLSFPLPLSEYLPHSPSLVVPRDVVVRSVVHNNRLFIFSIMTYSVCYIMERKTFRSTCTRRKQYYILYTKSTYKKPHTVTWKKQKQKTKHGLIVD